MNSRSSLLTTTAIGGAQSIEIGDSVWIEVNCIILPVVKIGRGSVIAANSVVVKSVPSMVVAGGSPAEVIKTYDAK